MTRRAWLFLFGAVASAQIVRPKLGYIVDRKGGLHPVEGVPGAFIVGPAVDQDVISAAYSGKSLVVKKERELIVDGKVFEAPPGPARIAFTSAGQLHQVFFSGGVSWKWTGNSFEEAYASDQYDPTNDTPIDTDGNLTVRGIPLRLASPVRRVSRMGEDWLVAYGDDRVFAIRDGQILEVPEDGE